MGRLVVDKGFVEQDGDVAPGGTLYEIEHAACGGKGAGGVLRVREENGGALPRAGVREKSCEEAVRIVPEAVRLEREGDDAHAYLPERRAVLAEGGDRQEATPGAKGGQGGLEEGNESVCDRDAAGGDAGVGRDGLFEIGVFEIGVGGE